MDWAENVASDLQLRLLADYAKRYGVGYINDFRHLAIVVCGGDDGQDAEEWPRKVIGSGIPRDYEAAYASAFIKAALEHFVFR